MIDPAKPRATSGFIQVPSLKLATILSKMKVPIVNPGVIKIRQIRNRKEVLTVTFHFGKQTVDGVYQTSDLIQAWNHAAQYLSHQDKGLAFVALFRQAIDHRDVILDVVKDGHLGEMVNPAPVEWIEEQMNYIASRYPELIVEDVGSCKVYVTEHTPKDVVAKCIELAEGME